ncbi:uncharacterized protein [Diadema setosum]|uniref:uncharacterized protein n=1 Tax=Diadema setosum TaxID=31175 RepID=UPI003B3A24A1
MSTVICEGYLTKSPPEHKINRARWCRRYFKLSSSNGELYLQYFKDNTCSKLKGSINLRECEQVDQGLSFETRSKLKDAHIFDIVTQRRKYFLVTETEADMLRWVQSICTACGFQSEDSLSDIGDVPDGLPPEPVETTLVAAQPVARTNGDESYIQLDECNTGDNPSSNHQLPPKVNGQVSAALQAQQHQKKWDTLSSTSSSAPSDTAPSPPESRPVSQVEGGMDIYDVPLTQTSDAPPVPQRPRTEESIYKVVPGTKDPMSYKFDRQISSAGSRGSFSNSDDTGGNSSYDFVRGSSERNSGMMFESTESDVMESNYDAPPPRPPPPPTTDEIYQVPPVRGSVDPQQENTYDIPPMSPPIESTYDVLPSPLQKTPKQPIPSHLRPSEPLSKSTDDLARSFEEISQNNAHQSFANGDLEHSTYDPVPAMDLNASIGSNSSFSMFRDMGPASDAMEAPPRPAKPSYMCTPTPPPSVDETYSIPTQSNHHISPQEVRRRLGSMELNSGSTPPQKNSPLPPTMGGQHKWLEQHIPVGYINTKRSSSSIAARPNSHMPPGRGYLAMRSNTLAGGRVASGVPLGFQNGQSASPVGQQQQPGSYMAMQGSSESPKMGLPLGGAITEDCYMPMQSQNEASPDMYTNMNSQVPSAAPAVPRRPPRPSTSSTISISSTTSGDSVPPPIDRRNKPRSTDSSIINPDMIGMEGSFYATGPELPQDFPVQNHRTKSFSRKSSSRHRDSPPIPSTPPRPHRSIHSSSSSHPDHSQLIADPYSVPPSSATSLVDDAYVFTDAPPSTKPRIEFHHFQTRHASIDSAIHPHSPTLPPRSHTVEYLELDHDSDAQGSSAPPPKATSPKDQVEYIHLDLEKTKALQEVTQNREECYRPKNSDSGTLKK